MSKLPYVLTLIVLVAALAGFVMVWRSGPTAPGSTGSLSVVDTSAKQEFSGPDVAGPRLSAFTLEERSGKPLDSRQLAGHVWVASFFFTTCAGSCVRLNQALQSLHDDPAFGQVSFVSISCDPENDTLDVLGDYAKRFGADPNRWFFCRGDLHYVQRIAHDMMRLPVERQTHANRAVVLDRHGKVRGRFQVTEPNQLAMMRRVLATCLGEPGAADHPGGMTEHRTDAQPAATGQPAAGGQSREPRHARAVSPAATTRSWSVHVAFTSPVWRWLPAAVVVSSGWKPPPRVRTIWTDHEALS